MRSRWSKLLLCYALVSILALAWNCGPTCEMDEASTSSQAAPCHQEPASDDAQGCDWDTGSLSMEGNGSSAFHLLPPSISFWFVFSAANAFSGLEKKSFQTDIITSHSFEVSHLSFVRILV
ncbi:hypothetical protein EHO59_09505 [Leptospira semungkisensis]|uniref:Secreted protein n=1 Tax=Leptospira semungkisensis TaxID=2484985 RepID=A0A4R9G207_9LEPT|nr:hypothetical protein [Leptospira semungkisensis]TGK05065.1 hypothetical protein EHO59_09505 [Leptospira semungkisensis]